MWNIRKKLIANGYLEEEREMDFTALVLTRKQKTAQAFTQRQFVWKRWQSRDEWLLPRLERDLSVCSKAADRYPNNYHAWNHRLWMVTRVMEEFILRSELDFSSSWLQTHVSDHSGVNYRQHLLLSTRNVLPSEFQKFVDRDFKLCSELINAYPGHEALWNFRRFLVKTSKDFLGGERDALLGEERDFCAAAGATPGESDQKRFADKHLEWLVKFL
jgi:protein prenyltransferase alpha subunit repeat containing protein 1